MTQEKLENIENNLEKKKVSKFSSKKIIIGCSIIAVTAVSIYSYYKYNKIFPSTDNAYVDANVINISAKVGGYLQKVYVENNQFVHKGDKLVQIEQEDYKLQVAKSRANIVQAVGHLAVANEQVDVAKSNISKAKASLKTATAMSNRYLKLYHENAGSLQDAQKYLDQKIQAQKGSEQALSSLKQAFIQVEVAKAQVNVAKVGVDNSNLNLSYTTLTAPSDGFVSNLKIVKGQLIAPGQSLFGFVDNKKWWINANFKETDLDRIKKGQKVDIQLDMYNHKYEGIVDSISYATGSIFSLLPAENATGNWVKVTQRFPVKITLKDSPNYPLRVGASADIKINTLGK